MSDPLRCPRCGGANFDQFDLSHKFCRNCGGVYRISDLVRLTRWQRFKERISYFWRKRYYNRKAANAAAFETFETFFDCAFKGVGYGFGFTTGVVMFFGWCKLFSIIFGE